MKTLSPDTHPDIERLWLESIRKMTPAEKVRRVVGCSNAPSLMPVCRNWTSSECFVFTPVGHWLSF